MKTMTTIVMMVLIVALGLTAMINLDQLRIRNAELAEARATITLLRETAREERRVQRSLAAARETLDQSRQMTETVRKLAEFDQRLREINSRPKVDPLSQEGLDRMDELIELTREGQALKDEFEAESAGH
jgi:hypothetical protein